MGGSSGSVPKVWRLYTTEEIQNSPSRPFMTLEKENLTRKQHTKLIKSAGQELKFSQTAGPVVVGAACTFFHRYFMMKSFAHNDPLIFAAASLFLACKTEDNPRALQDIYFTMFKLRYGKSHPDIVRKLQANKPFVEELRDTILTAERALMYTLGFEFEYIHPFKYYSEVLAGMGLKEEQMQPGTPQAIISSIMDANLSSVLLMGTSRHLCAAATQFILVNVGKHQIPLVEGKPWYVAFEPAAPELIPNIVTEMGRWYTIRPTAARTSRAVASHTAESAGPTPTSQPAAPVKRPALPGSQQHTSASAPPAQARRDGAGHPGSHQPQQAQHAPAASAGQAPARHARPTTPQPGPHAQKPHANGLSGLSNHAPAAAARPNGTQHAEGGPGASSQQGQLQGPLASLEPGEISDSAAAASLVRPEAQGTAHDQAEDEARKQQLRREKAAEWKRQHGGSSSGDLAAASHAPPPAAAAAQPAEPAGSAASEPSAPSIVQPVLPAAASLAANPAAAAEIKELMLEDVVDVTNGRHSPAHGSATSGPVPAEERGLSASEAEKQRLRRERLAQFRLGQSAAGTAGAAPGPAQPAVANGGTSNGHAAGQAAGTKRKATDQNGISNDPIEAHAAKRQV